MKLVRDSRTLKGKAIASLKIAMMTFNSYDDDGRICSVLLHLQHASEMFLEGAPVRYIGGDDPTEAAAVREVDLRKKFHMRASDLARGLKLKSKALRWHLGIDDDNNCCHVFEFGKSTFPCFSDNAKNRMKQALDEGVKMDEVWRVYQARA